MIMKELVMEQSQLAADFELPLYVILQCELNHIREAAGSQYEAEIFST